MKITAARMIDPNHAPHVGIADTMTWSLAKPRGMRRQILASATDHASPCSDPQINKAIITHGACVNNASAIHQDDFPLVEHLWKLLEEDTFEERLVVVVKMKTTKFAFQVILDVGVKLPLMQSVVWIEFEVFQSK
jgi:hypothetical protein